MNVLKMRQGGFRVSILAAGHDRPANPKTRDKDLNLMPNIDVNSPVISATTDRLALAVGWARPGAANLNPSTASFCSIFACFESIDE